MKHITTDVITKYHIVAHHSGYQNMDSCPSFHTYVVMYCWCPHVV